MIKRVLCFLMIMCLCVSLCACSAEKPTELDMNVMAALRNDVDAWLKNKNMGYPYLTSNKYSLVKIDITEKSVIGVTRDTNDTRLNVNGKVTVKDAYGDTYQAKFSASYDYNEAFEITASYHATFGSLISQ